MTASPTNRQTGREGGGESRGEGVRQSETAAGDRNGEGIGDTEGGRGCEGRGVRQKCGFLINTPSIFVSFKSAGYF